MLIRWRSCLANLENVISGSVIRRRPDVTNKRHRNRIKKNEILSEKVFLFFLYPFLLFFGLFSLSLSNKCGLLQNKRPGERRWKTFSKTFARFLMVGKKRERELHKGHARLIAGWKSCSPSKILSCAVYCANEKYICFVAMKGILGHVLVAIEAFEFTQIQLQCVKIWE